MNEPFSQNIIFYDTEFTHLDARTGELLSLALVKLNGEELYIEFDYQGEVHPWVREHVLPTLMSEKKYSKEEAKKVIREFIGENKPYLVAYVNQFDSVFWYDLFGSPQEHPVFWIPIDFAAMLFATGLDPTSMGKEKFLDSIGIDKSIFSLHNALDDAKLLRLVYKKYFGLQSAAGVV